MFSLIIVILSIALVIALAAAVIYYGGNTTAKATSRVAAETIVAQAEQIVAAGVIAVSQGSAWPADGPQFAPPFLKSMPVPPRAAYSTGLVPTAADWEYFLPASHFIALPHKISKDVCMELNRSAGLIGIPATMINQAVGQCFGVAEPYTFVYFPKDGTVSNLPSAIQKSVDDATGVLAGSPVTVVGVDELPAGGGTTVNSAVPGFPVLCPSGNYINSGACSSSLGSPSNSAGGTVPDATPSVYTCVNQSPMIDQYGSSYDGYNDVWLYITGPGVVDEFGDITMASVASDFKDLTGTVSPGSNYVNLVVIPGAHAVADNVPYVISGKTGAKVTCAQTVVESLGSVDTYLSYTVGPGPRTAAGGYALDLIADPGSSFTVGPTGQKPTVYWYDKLLPASAVTVLDSGTLHISSVPSFDQAGGYGATNFGYLMVQNYAAQNPGWAQFTYSDAPPKPAPPVPLTITEVWPWQGSVAGGQTATISGSGFKGNEVVTFGDGTATVTGYTDTELTVTTPAAVMWGKVGITVSQTSPQASTYLPNGYRYLLDTPPVSWSTMSPKTGGSAGGTLVTISGTGFTVNTEVYFGQAQATVESFTPTTLNVRTPAGTGMPEVFVVEPSNNTNMSRTGEFQYGP